MGSTSGAVAQQPPIRPLGPIIQESTEPIQGVAAIRVLPHGRLLANEIVARRLLLFDSTLSKITVALDSASGKPNYYGPRFGGLIPYRGDSTLFVDIANQWMLVIDGDGRVIRTMTLPRPDASFLIGGPYGQPALDTSGRLIFMGWAQFATRPRMDVPGSVVAMVPDSAPIVRFDFASHRLDTAAMVKNANDHFMVHRFETGSTTQAPIHSVIYLADDWAAVDDGSIAIVRGRDFRVEWANADGTHVSGPKIPFDWERIDDEGHKQALVDSSRAYWERIRASHIADGSQRNPPPIYMASSTDLPDYMPAFARPSTRADNDGNIWIRTTTVIHNGAIYYVVNRKGELIDRVQVPPHRSIIGFGEHDFVYMTVVDSGGVRIDRARIR